MQCQAKAKKTGRQCNRRAVSGKQVCTVHGGLTPSGLASPHYKHGRYSKHLPSRLASKYLEAEADPNLLDLRADIALIDTRLSEILDNLENGDTRKLWQDLKAAFDEFEMATISQDKTKQRIGFIKLKDIIGRGNAIYASWGEVYGVIDQRRRTVESERKRLVEMQQTITAERAMLLIGALIGVIRQHVTDTATLQAISQDIRAITVIDGS